MITAKRLTYFLGAAVLSAGITGCTGAPANPNLARQCEQGLKIAYEELDFAKTNGLDDTLDWTKAASLLSAAKIQEEFGKYPNCVDKVKRARYYIRQSQG